MSGAAAADVVVIGAGHNGLVAALRLARAGRRVTVLERREVAGGLAAAEEFHPGHRAPGLLHDTHRLAPRIAAELGLERHGLAWRERPTLFLGRRGDGPRLTAAGGDGLAAWRDSIAGLRPFLDRLLERPPPRFELRRAADLLRLGLDGVALRRLGRRRARELLRVLPMPAADWLGEWLDDGELAGAVALPALLGVFGGPRSPGTAAGVLMGENGAGREVAGGPAALIAALVAAAGAAGVEIRTDAAVAAIELDGGRVGGVRLESGEAVPAAAVAAAGDPVTVLLGLLPPGSLGLADERALATYRSRGTVAALHLALSAPPAFAAAGGAAPELVRIGDLDELERASDAVKYGELPERPPLELRLPSRSAPGLATAGGATASVLVARVPHAPAGGWTAELERRLEVSVMKRLEEVAPGIGARVVGRRLLTPPAIAERYGVTGGHLFHGEMALDQLLSLRPAPCAGGYRTPIAGLFLCGSGSHPGGGITGLPGWLGAGALLAG